MLSRLVASRPGACRHLARRPNPTVGAAALASARRPDAHFFLSTDAGVEGRNLDDAAWERAFLAATDNVRGDDTHAESVSAIRSLLSKGLMCYTDLSNRPERFFKAHRLLARHALEHGPGFWIRFTVHFNLCFGTVLAVGGDAQRAALAPGGSLASAGALGCFALTERFAGVQSGLVVQTTAKFDAATKGWVLHSPSEGAYKNWISQGFTADKAVVVAALTDGDGVARGPHAFLMDLRKAPGSEELTPGVSVGDMGHKTTGNDLDNAWIKFDNVQLPLDNLLDGHATVDEHGKYQLTTEGMPPFAMIGQRLYTGRVAVAQAALEFRRQLYKITRSYTDAKRVWHATDGPDDASFLSSVPQLKALYVEAEERAAEVEAHCARCEAQLAELLRVGAVPDERLAFAIATAKVKAVETSIELCWRLKQEVGSYAFMADAGFRHLDFLQACKFAEGDSRILMQKMARDRFRRYSKKDPDTAVAPSEEEEERLCVEIHRALAAAAPDKKSQQAAWDESWETVYALAEATMARGMAEFAAIDNADAHASAMAA